MRRACCASTLFASISRGCSKASRIARFVISLNITRWNFALLPRLSSSWRCPQIASPPRARSLGGGRELGGRLLLLREHGVGRVEGLLVHAERPLREVADVPHRGLDHV